MPLKVKKIAAIQVEYCAGFVTIEKVAKKHKVSSRTVIRLAKKNGWKRGKRGKNVTNRVTSDILKKAEDKFIKKESDRLAKATEKHIADIYSIRTLTRLNLSDMMNAARDAKNSGGSLHKEVTENFFAFQKVCKISTETLANCYREERLALGIDDKADESRKNIKSYNFSELTNEQLADIINES